VIAGVTTLEAVQGSVAQLSRARVRLLIDGRGFVSPITDDADPIVGPSQVHAFVEAGSAAIGVRGRWAFSNGLTLLGGFSTGSQDHHGIRVDNQLAASLALRYAPASFGGSRPFVEVGALTAASGELRALRPYANGAGQATGVGVARFTSTALWGRLGWIWGVDKSGQLGAYLEYGYQRQWIDGYLEPTSNLNPFEALVAPGADTLQVGKIGLRASHAGKGWEASAALSVAHAFQERQSLFVVVDGFGRVVAPHVGEQTWVEYGARIGHAITASSSAGAFVTGVVGQGPIGASADIGLDYKVTF
jgi:hypothetical protein